MTGIWALTIGTVLAGAFCLVRQRLVVVTVTGTSMRPSYLAGQRVLVWRRRRHLRTGDVVVLERPDPGRGWRKFATRRWLIKRVAAVAGERVPEASSGSLVPPGFLFVLGDDRGSYDSRHFGLCPVERVLGVVLCRIV